MAGYVDPKHDAGILIQRITEGTLRATEASTDGRYAEDDTNTLNWTTSWRWHQPVWRRAQQEPQS